MYQYNVLQFLTLTHGKEGHQMTNKEKNDLNKKIDICVCRCASRAQSEHKCRASHLYMERWQGG
jgi:hypothetical protein